MPKKPRSSRDFEGASGPVDPLTYSVRASERLQPLPEELGVALLRRLHGTLPPEEWPKISAEIQRIGTRRRYPDDDAWADLLSLVAEAMPWCGNAPKLRTYAIGLATDCEKFSAELDPETPVPPFPSPLDRLFDAVRAYVPKTTAPGFFKAVSELTQRISVDEVLGIE